ncbi:MAG: tRNA (guanosine(37)-N1)-methyltransferase TrmD [Candidatus Portnoybacteria bacterium]|nr:tRNA (guanosine(37)-N1)-methyltransferase TrmD [Candidatus Portnoybacteria bacterium]
MRFDIVTIFPNIFNSYLKESIIKRAQAKKLVKINIHNLRDYTRDKRKTVDDKPYGGGFGMVLMVEPIYQAVKDIKKRSRAKKRKVILLSAKGKKFDQKMAWRFSKLDQLILICGRYEGIDERVAKYIADEEISVGDYILTGGELPAINIVDTVTRLVPGVIAKGSLEEESFSQEKYIEYPHYTRPESVKINGQERKVPKILLSGNHQKIEKWQEKHSKYFGP